MASTIIKMNPFPLTDSSGKTDNFEAQFVAYWPRITAVLFRLLGDHAEAEDLALEVFLRLHQNPPAHEKNLGGWLYRTATNLGLNALRARTRRIKYEQESGHWVQNPAGNNPAILVEQSLERERVRQILAQLDKREAALLILHYSGFNYSEIAASLNISVGSVGTLLARAEAEFEARFIAWESDE